MTRAQIGEINYAVQLSNGRHVFNADEPVDKGGLDLGPTPDELLESALASCTAITLRMYIARKEWSVDEIRVEVTMVRTEDASTFTRNILVKGDITEEQRNRLLQIAQACPVSKTLHGKIVVNSEIT